MTGREEKKEERNGAVSEYAKLCLFLGMLSAACVRLWAHYFCQLSKHTTTERVRTRHTAAQVV